MLKTRRKFIKQAGTFTLATGVLGWNSCGNPSEKAEETKSEAIVNEVVNAPFFEISLAQWSLNRSFFDGKLDNLDFAKKAKESFGINAIEYVNQFFLDKGEDMDYLAEMKKRADDLGVKSLLIMIDKEGDLGSTDDTERTKAIENHYKWVNAAKFLGCHSIRVNAAGKGTAEEVSQAAIDGLGRLSEYAGKEGLNVIVENHGGFSSDGNWLSNVISSVGLDNCGTLPDFGNFCVERGDDGCKNEYDRYLGVKQLMPFAKAVSAKSNEFDENGNEVRTDFKKMLQIVKDAEYSGFIGVEYEGSKLSEDEGILATKMLMERAGKELSYYKG